MPANITLEEALSRQYRFDVIADPDGGYVILFPDLPGCMTQVENIDDVGPVADEIRILWIETTFDMGQDIPLPTYPYEFSGKFNVRIPKSLHRDLVHLAAEEGVSLNQLVVSLLSNRSAWRGGDAKAATTPNADSPQRLVKVG
jgi:predicted RNase H-like HicB family nuclease